MKAIEAVHLSRRFGNKLAVDAGRAALRGNYVNLLTDIPVLLGWTLLMFALAVWQFGRRLRGG